MDPQETARQPLRLAILASPRTGNNWLRTLLVRSYGLKPFAAHDAAEIPWDALPPRAVVNLHWLPTPDLLARLDGFRVLTLARHPLDTLISILHFAPHHEATNRWLLGRGGNEDGIRSAAPTSPEFLDYATGPRPAELFAVTARWWDVPGVIRVRYEDLVADTPGELRRIAAEIGAPPVVPPEEAAASCSLDELRVASRDLLHHVWKGQPGLWRRLLPADRARGVAGAHREVFATLCYGCDPDPALSDAQARANWLSIEAETNRRDTDQLWDLIEATRAAAAEAEARRAAATERLVAADALLAETHTRLAQTEARLAAAEARRQETVERLVKADDLLRDTHARMTRAEARFARAERRLAETEAELTDARQRLDAAHSRSLENDTRLAAVWDRLGLTEDRLATAHETIERLAGELDSAHARLAEADARLAGTGARLAEALALLAERDARLAEQDARLAGTGAAGLALARRLSRLSARFPRASQGAKQVLRTVRGLRRAA